MKIEADYKKVIKACNIFSKNKLLFNFFYQLLFIYKMSKKGKYIFIIYKIIFVKTK